MEKRAVLPHSRIWFPGVLMWNQGSEPRLNVYRSFEANRFERATQEKAYLRALPTSQRLEAAETEVRMERSQKEG